MQVFKLSENPRKMIPNGLHYSLPDDCPMIMSANITEEDPQAKGFTRNKQIRLISGKVLY